MLYIALLPSGFAPFLRISTYVKPPYLASLGLYPSSFVPFCPFDSIPVFVQVSKTSAFY